MEFLRKQAVALLLLLALVVTGSPVAYGSPDFSSLQGQSYLVMEAKTGQVLLEKEGDQRRAPASITKILTCALALEKGGLDQRVTMERETVYSIPANTTHIALEEGEVLTVRDLLYSTMLLSANDAANGLAQYTGGSLDGFTQLMNDQVEQLGLANTHFDNAHGLDDQDHYTSARDMALITRWALGVEGFRSLFGTTEYDMPITNKKNRDYDFINQDAMLHTVNKVYYEGVVGGKLGYTTNAQHTIVSVAKRGDLELICVVLGSGLQTKYSDSAALMDYCFQNYDFLTLPANNIKDFQVPLLSGDEAVATLDIRAVEDVSLVVKKGTTLRDLKYQYQVADSYTRGQDIAPTLELTTKQGEYLTTVPLSYTQGEAAHTPISRLPKPAPGAQNAASGTWVTVAKWVSVGFLGLVVLLFVVRFFVRLHYRRLRRRAIRLRAYQQAKQRPGQQRVLRQPGSRTHSGRIVGQ